MSTFATVGNCYQPFTRLLREVAQLAEQGRLPEPVFVQYGHTPFASDRCRSSAFLGREEFVQRMSAATLVVVHAGAGTMIEAIRAGKVPVVMPRLSRYGEHVDEHQTELARFLAGAGRIALAEEPQDLPAAVQRALELQTRREGLADARSEPALIGLVRRTLEDWDRASRA